MEIARKYDRLKEILSTFSEVAIAFSGGVDSTFLARVARDVLGEKKVLLLTAHSPAYPRYELEESKRLAAEMHLRQLVVLTRELEIPEYAQNTRERCYRCKKELFALCWRHCNESGISLLFDGSNVDDADDFRPGSKAVKEASVRSPLVEAGLTKDEIRYLSRELGLSTWHKQPFACLATRFPYGFEITRERLERIDRCEEVLRQRGFRNYRVRYHGETARIEVAADEISRFFEEGLRAEVVERYKAQGFTYVALDLQGYRSGSLNEVTP